MKLKVALMHGFGRGSKPKDFGKACGLIEQMPKKPDTVIFPEYSFHIRQLIDFSDDIRAAAKRFRSNFLFVPSTIDTGAIDGIPPHWGTMKRMLSCKKINFEKQDGANRLFPDSIGLWFSSDDMVFAFPKSFWQMPVHRIPDGKTAVSICGEINCIKENDLEGVQVIYNPSKEYGVFTYATQNPGVLEYEWPNPKIANAIAGKRVPIIRCDTRKGSGIIHLPEGIGIDFKQGELISELILYPI